MDVAAIRETIETVKAWVFPISAAVLFCVYPLVVLIWTILEGRAASQAAKAPVTRIPITKDVTVPVKPVKRSLAFSLRGRFASLRLNGWWGRSRSLLSVLAAMGIGACILAYAGRATSFVVASVGLSGLCGQGPTLARPVALPGFSEDTQMQRQIEAQVATSPAAAYAIAVAGAALAAGYGLRQASLLASGGKARECRPRRTPSTVIRRCFGTTADRASGPSVPRQAVHARLELPAVESRSAQRDGVRWFAPPPDSISMWHHVELHVKNWLDEDTGLLHYVNEIPKGALQKFELQTKLPNNAIREDPEGSAKMKMFGQPVPFNYGCFPQTFRDPEEVDELYGAPGDDDPLDVVDLSFQAAGVGEVLCCRVLGAVCLIDEGQADWKVFVVNTNAKDQLAGAKNIEEVERMAPGRIKQALRWLDDLKQFNSDGQTELHYEIHDASRAMSIINKDHAAWSRLVAKADSTGFARGHWVRAAPNLRPLPQVMPVGSAQLAAPGQVAHVPSTLAGTSLPTMVQPSYAMSRGLTLRRQISVVSDGGDSSSSYSETSPRSSGSGIDA